MEYLSASFAKQNNNLFIRSLIILLLGCCGTIKLDFCFPSNNNNTPPPQKSFLKVNSLKALTIDGNFSFESNEFAAKDYGNQYHFHPLAVLYPKSITDIAITIKHVWQLGPSSRLTIAPRGHGHSIQGQSQAELGIVINMESLKGQTMHVDGDHRSPYVDVYAGELWIDILHVCLKYGFAPKSWTDYLHLTVGGTLSNAGISGQAFRHGPQISNVYQLEVVTGKGEVVICSEEHNADLFHGVLGGLGQFGVITRARIALEPAPKLVKWIRVLYSDFSKFTRDQEYLITTKKNTFDYIEGFVLINRTGVINKWKSTFTPHNKLQASQFVSDGKTLYCLELNKKIDPENPDATIKEIEDLLSKLSYIPSTLFMTEVTYIEFLDRVHTSEQELRAKGMWDLPHPWMNLLIPRNKIKQFAHGVFGTILPHTNNGPVLIYPVNKSKWDNRTSFVSPEDDDIFYMVAFLYYAKENDGLEELLIRNKRINDFCESANLGVKQYLPHYTTREQWRKHFGQKKWDVFAQRKLAYDPLSILTPGQRIFQKGVSAL